MKIAETLNFRLEIGKIVPYGNRVEYGIIFRFGQIYFAFTIAAKNYAALEREALKIKPT